MFFVSWKSSSLILFCYFLNQLNSTTFIFYVYLSCLAISAKRVVFPIPSSPSTMTIWSLFRMCLITSAGVTIFSLYFNFLSTLNSKGMLYFNLGVRVWYFVYVYNFPLKTYLTFVTFFYNILMNSYTVSLSDFYRRRERIVALNC